VADFGSSAETFQEGDIVFSPGCGRRLLCNAMCWPGSPDKEALAWNGSSDPIEVSWKMAAPMALPALDGVDDGCAVATRSCAGFLWALQPVMVLVLTQNNAYFDWCQTWMSRSFRPQSQLGGVLTKTALLSEPPRRHVFLRPDRGKRHVLSGTRLYLSGRQSAEYLPLAGRVQRQGKRYVPVAGSEFTDHDAPGFKKRYRWLDAITSRIDAVKSFSAAAVVSDGVSLDRKPSDCDSAGARSGAGRPHLLSGKNGAAGTAVGRFMRWFIRFPQDDNDAELYQGGSEGVRLWQGYALMPGRVGWGNKAQQRQWTPSRPAKPGLHKSDGWLRFQSRICRRVRIDDARGAGQLQCALAAGRRFLCVLRNFSRIPARRKPSVMTAAR